MRVNGKPQRSIALAADGRAADIIDQTLLPHAIDVRRLETLEQTVEAIREMRVRGAPLIGATAAFGIWLAMMRDPSDESLQRAATTLRGTRPTAVNLRAAVDEMVTLLQSVSVAERAATAGERAAAYCEEDIRINRGIGEHGVELLEDLAGRAAHRPVQILTHCNAGWLATVDWGTASAPIYLAHQRGIELHVWVSETRPRNQGAALTAWELGHEGIAHTVIADNAAGHLLQRGLVDICITGTDRTTAIGDVCNKIGTYLKALAAHDNGIPFYAAVPSPSIDWQLTDGATIPIEERDAMEVTHVRGLADDGAMTSVQVTPSGSPASNYGFDVTPARLVTGLITERGVCKASADGLRALFPERASAGVVDSSD